MARGAFFFTLKYWLEEIFYVQVLCTTFVVVVVVFAVGNKILQWSLISTLIMERISHPKYKNKRRKRKEKGEKHVIQLLLAD